MPSDDADFSALTREQPVRRWPESAALGRRHGTASNVMAGRARLEGTIRAQDLEVRRQLSSSVKRIAESIAQLHGAQGQSPNCMSRALTHIVRLYLLGTA